MHATLNVVESGAHTAVVAAAVTVVAAGSAAAEQNAYAPVSRCNKHAAAKQVGKNSGGEINETSEKLDDAHMPSIVWLGASFDSRGVVRRHRRR